MTNRPRTERLAFSIPEFCLRNGISRPTYRRLRLEGRGPAEMRLGLNNIRITIEAEGAWRRRMEEPREDLVTQATERAVRAGNASLKSPKHISRRYRAPALSMEEELAEQRHVIRELSRELRELRKVNATKHQ